MVSIAAKGHGRQLRCIQVLFRLLRTNRLLPNDTDEDMSAVAGAELELRRGRKARLDRA